MLKRLGRSDVVNACVFVRFGCHFDLLAQDFPIPLVTSSSDTIDVDHSARNCHKQLTTAMFVRQSPRHLQPVVAHDFSLKTETMVKQQDLVAVGVRNQNVTCVTV